jgi:thiamine biosynthesis lipoprotein
MLEVLTCALDIHRLSAGAFDPGVGRWWMPGALARRDAPDAAAIRIARQAAHPPDP